MNCSTVVFDGLIGSSLGCSNLTASPAEKTSWILRCDWLLCNNINILLTKHFLSRWLDNGLDRVFFFFFKKKSQKRSYVIISSHLVSRLVNTPEIAFLIAFRCALFSLGNENDEEIHSRIHKEAEALMQLLYLPWKKGACVVLVFFTEGCLPVKLLLKDRQRLMKENDKHKLASKNYN